MNSWPGMRVIRQRFAMLVADGDSLVVEADDAGVGGCDAEDVAGEIIEHRLLAFAPGRALYDPGLRPDGVGQNQVGTALLQPGPEFAADELGQGPDGNQEGSARRSPIGAVVGNAASCDQTMDMGVVEQLLRPGVQDGEHADGRSDMASVASELDDGLGGGLHQEGVAVTLVGAQRVP